MTGGQTCALAILLNLSAACFERSGLGYIGTDIVLDKKRGPLLLELNARPGLSIQIANGAGLLPRLRKIEKMLETDAKKMSVADRVKFAMDNFGVLQP